MPLGEGNIKRFRLGDEDHKTNRDKSIEREKKAQAALGAKVTKNSGASRWLNQKGDLRNDHFVWEQKSTEGPRISINATVIGKVSKEARLTGRIPGLHLVVENIPDNLPSKWVAVPEHAWEEIYNAYLLLSNEEFE